MIGVKAEPRGRDRRLRWPEVVGRRGAAEVFVEANRFGANYSLEIASADGNDVITSIRTCFAVTRSISSVEFADTVVVVGGDTLVGSSIDPALVEALKTVPARTGVWHRYVRVGSSWPRPDCSTAGVRPRIGGTPDAWPEPFSI